VRLTTPPRKRLLSRNLKKQWPDTQLAEASEEGQGPRRAVKPMMMIFIVRNFVSQILCKLKKESHMDNPHLDNQDYTVLYKFGLYCVFSIPFIISSFECFPVFNSLMLIFDANIIYMYIVF
jgi:hypothetical protein